MTPAQVYALAAQHLIHEAAIVATAIAWGESHLDPEAVGDENLVDEKWGPSIGLWQVRSLRAHLGTGGERDAERLKDPAFNAASMATISKQGTNWTPWTVYRNGSYRSHLAAVREAVDLEEPMTPAAIILAAMAELESLGYDVVYVNGWGSRGNASFEPQGFLFHHTATSALALGDYPSLGIVRDGVDQGGGYWLPGPLSQFGLGRSGTVYVIAAGRANHAGGGGWNGLSGNYSVWGCEAENNGLGEPWPPEQVDAYLALATVMAKHTGFGADMVCRHAEWSSAGKIDTATAPLDDGDWIRAQVAARLAGGTAPPPPPPPPEEDDTMRIINVAERGIFIAYGDGSADHIGHPDEVFELVGVGVPYVADKELSAQTFERRWPRAAPAPHAEEYEAMVGEVRARLAPPPLSCAEAE